VDQLISGDRAAGRSSSHRLNVSYTVLRQAPLIELVTRGFVNGWDDPACPPWRGCGGGAYTPAAIRNFAAAIGSGKNDNSRTLGLRNPASATT
jgi:glutaminyl-tRNA synthetase